MNTMHARTFLLLLSVLAVATGCGNNPLCDGDGDGYCAPDDCDDNDADIHPDQPDVCDGVDGNCNGQLADEERIDRDEDGVAQCFDCDDEDPTVAAGFEEVCDGVDNDCDGEVPAGELVDEDGDTWTVCTDCVDTDPARNPGAEEVCDGQDNNCDGVFFTDEATGTTEVTDDDGDGFAPCMGDCDDQDGDRDPENYEIAGDGVDNDCDGEADQFAHMSPENDLPYALDLLLSNECAAHGRTPVTVDFEGAPVGDHVGPTPTGLTLDGNIAGDVLYRFADDTLGDGPWEGERWARPESPVDGVRLRFSEPQTLLLWAISGVSPNDGPNYSAAIYWEGVEVGGLASIWGTTNPDFGWNHRGVWSYANVAFDELVITDPVAGGEYVGFDSISFCE